MAGICQLEYLRLVVKNLCGQREWDFYLCRPYAGFY